MDRFELADVLAAVLGLVGFWAVIGGMAAGSRLPQVAGSLMVLVAVVIIVEVERRHPHG